MKSIQNNKWWVIALCVVIAVLFATSFIGAAPKDATPEQVETYLENKYANIDFEFVEDVSKANVTYKFRSDTSIPVVFQAGVHSENPHWTLFPRLSYFDTFSPSAKDAVVSDVTNSFYLTINSQDDIKNAEQKVIEKMDTINEQLSAMGLETSPFTCSFEADVYYPNGRKEVIEFYENRDDVIEALLRKPLH